MFIQKHDTNEKHRRLPSCPKNAFWMCADALTDTLQIGHKPTRSIDFYLRVQNRAGTQTCSEPTWFIDNSIRRKAKPSRPILFIARLRIRVRFALLALRTGPFLDRNHGFSTFEFVTERASLDAFVVIMSKERKV